jgi:hypothetical protein
LARLFSLRHEFSSPWYRFLNPPVDSDGDQTLIIALTKDRFAWLDTGSGMSWRLDPHAIQDILVVCHYTCS